jgi:hypothetical protein
VTICWKIRWGDEVINVKFRHIEQAIDAACSVLTKEQCFNDKVKDNPAQVKAYDIHVAVLRLLEKVFSEAFEHHADHQRRMIPHGKR